MTFKLLARAFFFVAFISLAGIAQADHHGSNSHDQSGKVFELRTYTTYDGKLDNLHERFANHTMKIFENHGMTNIAYWTPTDKKNTLIYVVSHKSAAAAKQNWDGFRNDPKWQKAYKDSRKNGKIVEKVESVFMSATAFSPMK